MSTQAEFLNLIAECQGLLQKVCSIYCRDTSEREDLFQEILFQLWKSFEAFDKERAVKFSTWLYRVAINTALTYQKNSKKRRLMIFYPDYQRVEDQIQLYEEEDENRKLLYTVIYQLKEFDRALLLLHLEGYKYKEIEDIIGLNANAIGVKLNRIKKEIQKYIALL